MQSRFLAFRFPAMSPSEDFQHLVLAAARELFPDSSFVPHPDSEESIMAGEHQVGLQNLRAKFELTEKSMEDLKNLLKQHLGPILATDLPDLAELSLEEVRVRVQPQIMPDDYTASAPVPIVSFPMSSQMNVGIVADFPQTYMYVREQDLQRWEITKEALYEMALANLEVTCQNLQMNLLGKDPNVMIAIQTGDGYDAARILVPSLQKFLASHLGETFRFAVPNRDFLICWRLDCEHDFHENISATIAKDHLERPYPLSSSVFVRNSEGNIQEQRQDR